MLATTPMSLQKKIVGGTAVAAMLLASSVFAQSIVPGQPNQPGQPGQPVQPGQQVSPTNMNVNTGTSNPNPGMPNQGNPSMPGGSVNPTMAPGAPNTGAGGAAGENALILGVSALVAAAGAVYLSRRFAKR